MLLYPSQVEHLWFRQKQVEASSRKCDCVLYGRMGICYTEAQCEAMVMCGNNHRIITPNLARSLQIDLWPGGSKSYLWQTVHPAITISTYATLTRPNRNRLHSCVHTIRSPGLWPAWKTMYMPCNTVLMNDAAPHTLLMNSVVSHCTKSTAAAAAFSDNGSSSVHIDYMWLHTTLHL